MAMRMITKKFKGGSEVNMTPLIDCVFLLLVFFLVTSMLKRKERQIPMTLADTSAAVAEEAREEATLIALSEGGVLHQATTRTSRGVQRFEPAPDAAALLKEIADKQGLNSPLELIVQREAPFQTVINTIDLIELQGFTNVRTRVRDGDL